ncbi:hypothetical protein CUJ84_Chr002300 [Rhizobium leguminosarum]|uniref:Uncharacterized protein n=1 Tax=Rhizobium leguminosarum TaxID=384 RepID=A0A2K9Z314_RHILE|nr:hypothetical protein CUJ84_Chr002300 [Rhizobium leguminosarum]
MEIPEYFLGMHAFFDGEVVFARDVVQVNFDLSPFPVDFDSVWSWFKEQLRVRPSRRHSRTSSLLRSTPKMTRRW